jgi:TetR/AcrR family transcriptional repressor of nem operon
LDAILAGAGVTKGALYHHFDNKEALGYAVVDEIIATNLHRKWVRPLRNAEDPIDVLVRIIQSESLKRVDIQRGCPLLNLSQEMSGIDEGFRRRTASVYKDWHDAVEEALREGQKRKVVRSDRYDRCRVGWPHHRSRIVPRSALKGEINGPKDIQDNRIS